MRKIIAIVVCAAFFSMGVMFCASCRKPQLESARYTVRHGDTLWSIAEAHCPEEMDIREYISMVSDRNNISATIYPGQTLTIYRGATND